MASYTIPEDVIGIPLFVPSAHDYFSIDVGGMPNGEDCLVVNGAVSTNYKAFQHAQVLTPAVFTSRQSADWTMSFWFKCATTTLSPLPGHNGIQQTLMGVQTAVGPSSYSSTNDYVWNIGRVNAGAEGRLCFVANTGGGNCQTLADMCDDNWHLITFIADGSVTFKCYWDTNESGHSFSRSGVPASVANMYFSIGSYGSASPSFNQQWRLGKLAFHSHMLNVTERTLLYNQMMGV